MQLTLTFMFMIMLICDFTVEKSPHYPCVEAAFILYAHSWLILLT